MNGQYFGSEYHPMPCFPIGFRILLLMNPASVLMYYNDVSLHMIAAAYITGFPFDVVHGTGTVLFLWFAARPFLEKFDRIRTKYGILNVSHTN